MFKSYISRRLAQWHYVRLRQDLQQLQASMAVFSPLSCCATAVNTLVEKLNNFKYKSIHGRRLEDYSTCKPLAKKRAVEGGNPKVDAKKDDDCDSKQGGKGSSNTPKLVPVQEAHRFMKDCFLAVKTPEKHADAIADVLVAADYYGHQSHGMNRIEAYLREIEKNNVNPAAVPKLIKETPATAWVEGCNALGVIIGNYCMDVAIKKATEVGTGIVCAKHSNHYGIAMWYPLRAMNCGLIGMTMSNAAVSVTPTRSKEAVLGTNPICLGAIGKDDRFLLDMATSAAPMRKIEMLQRKGEKMPDGWALDAEGCPMTDPATVLKDPRLLPLGGLEASHGYKGYGLGAMVDVLSGVMSGSNHSTCLPKFGNPSDGTAANLGQIYMAINPNCFAPGFQERLAEFLCVLRKSVPSDPSKPVLVAGDKETMSKKTVEKNGGIQYFEDQLKTCTALAERLKVKALNFI